MSKQQGPTISVQHSRLTVAWDCLPSSHVYSPIPQTNNYPECCVRRQGQLTNKHNSISVYMFRLFSEPSPCYIHTFTHSSILQNRISIKSDVNFNFKRQFFKNNSLYSNLQHVFCNKHGVSSLIHNCTAHILVWLWGLSAYFSVDTVQSDVPI